jgi:hypothetical protein
MYIPYMFRSNWPFRCSNSFFLVYLIADLPLLHDVQGRRIGMYGDGQLGRNIYIYIYIYIYDKKKKIKEVHVDR